MDEAQGRMRTLAGFLADLEKEEYDEIQRACFRPIQLGRARCPLLDLPDRDCGRVRMREVTRGTWGGNKIPKSYLRRFGFNEKERAAERDVPAALERFLDTL